jgi:predicted metalloprotease with PDZ domain
MRALWTRHGVTGIGVEEDGVERLAEEVTGLKLRRSFDEWLRSTRELPLAALLSAHGVRMVLRPAESSSDRGGRPAGPERVGGLALLGALARADGDEAVLSHVLDGGAARDAGLAAGDVIVAVDGLRPGRGGLDAALAKRRPGETVKLHAFRRDELLEFDVRLKPAPADTCVLSELPGVKARLLTRWLEGRRG